MKQRDEKGEEVVKGFLKKKKRLCERAKVQREPRKKRGNLELEKMIGFLVIFKETICMT